LHEYKHIALPIDPYIFKSHHQLLTHALKYQHHLKHSISAYPIYENLKHKAIFARHLYLSKSCIGHKYWKKNQIDL